MRVRKSVRNTIYDIASLTKPIATSGLLMKLIESGAIELDTPARSLLPELVADGGERITIAHLVGHSAGFPDHVKFYERIWSGDLAGAASAREGLVRMAGATPLSDAPGQVTRYSDVGYILLGAALERAAGERLDRAAARLVLDPLAMRSTFFVNLDAPRSARRAIAPTELCERRGLLVGEVHDENAHAGGGICGHAGLFSTAGDVARFAAAVLAAVAGEAGHFDPRHRAQPDRDRVERPGRPGGWAGTRPRAHPASRTPAICGRATAASATWPSPAARCGWIRRIAATS